MKPDNPVAWFEIYVADMDRARAFYTAVFGRELNRLDETGDELEMYAFPWSEDGGGAPGALVHHPLMAPGQGGTLVYFACRDVSEEAERAAQNGGTIHRPKMSIGKHGFIALVRDSEGNVIGLYSHQ